ncbi:hypothetical protein [Kitasatospora sp. NPDC058478]|uniref:hypothetical protein n=1 Tax=unclassified Kitasatospora TaxID=2633591 RepID=UPI003661E201
MTTPRQAGRRQYPDPARLLNELDSPEWLARTQPSRAGTRTGSGRPAGAAPVNVELLQHIADSDSAVSDFIAQARAAAQAEPQPAPADRSEAYREAGRRAAELGGDWQAYLDAMAWRSAVESALHMGDTSVVRAQPCPQCGTVGLVWVRALRKVSCVNRHCAVTAEGGAPRTWTLAQLAVARQRGQRSALKTAI